MNPDWIDVAVIGAGPHGVSVRSRLGRAVSTTGYWIGNAHTWAGTMPEGMLLRSQPWAASISDPAGEWFERFVDERRLPDVTLDSPIRCDTCMDYADWFIEHERVVVDRRLRAGARRFLVSTSRTRMAAADGTRGAPVGLTENRARVPRELGRGSPTRSGIAFLERLQDERGRRAAHRRDRRR